MSSICRLAFTSRDFEVFNQGPVTKERLVLYKTGVTNTLFFFKDMRVTKRHEPGGKKGKMKTKAGVISHKWTA